MSEKEKIKKLKKIIDKRISNRPIDFSDYYYAPNIAMTYEELLTLRKALTLYEFSLTGSKIYWQWIKESKENKDG